MPRGRKAVDLTDRQLQTLVRRQDAAEEATAKLWRYAVALVDEHCVDAQQVADALQISRPTLYRNLEHRRLVDQHDH